MIKKDLKQNTLPARPMNKEAYQMLGHFKRFNKQMGLDFETSIVVACSGGVDSMALAHLLIYSGVNIRLLHVDHGTRSEIAQEIRLIKTFAQTYNVEFKSVKLSLSLNDGNFEALARKERYRLLKAELKKGELLVTGHHLDDCFEWSLLQQFKSQGKDIDLGIPYRNGQIYRPLFAFSKKHILKYAKLTKLSWIEDFSNNDTRFERNHIRKMITESISCRWPGYLKHYCERMNRMKALKESLPEREYKILRRPWGVLIKHHATVDEQLKKIILAQTDGQRGKTYKQFNELSKLMNSSKLGPLTFSGGIRVYCLGPWLAVVKKGETLKFFDDETTQIPGSVPFLSVTTRAKNGLKQAPIENDSLKKIFSAISQPVHYSWRKDGKVLVWL